MKNKLKNKLFEKFELKPSSMESLVGGFYTSASHDTNADGNGNYDVCHTTYDECGEQSNDTSKTGTGSLDKPFESLTNSFTQH